jgi:hypothetical protein
MSEAEASASDPEQLPPLDPVWISDKFKKHTDPSQPPPARLMGAKAMVPMPPRDMVHVVYACMLDPEPKIAAIARKTFAAFDDKILNAVLADAIAPEVLLQFSKDLIKYKEHLEKILLNKATPDAAFVQIARYAEDNTIIGMVAGNQARLIKNHDIMRGLADNPKALRSEIDRAIDFLVREGVFLDDVREFEDSFLRLGKGDMLKALQKIKVTPKDLNEHEKEVMDRHGLTPEQVLEGGEEVNELLAAATGADNEDELPRTPLNQLGVAVQIKLALTGKHARAIEGLKSTNRMVAGAAIRNPAIKDGDVMKIAHNRSMHEDVIRFICNNGDWTKNYKVKLALVKNPKCPPRFVMQWMGLLRKSDLKSLSRDKSIPSSVQTQAKRLMQAKEGRR